MSLNLTDSHTHLDSKEFDEDRELVVKRAVSAGVSRIITIGAGSGFDSAMRATALAEQYPCVWATAGIHPHDGGIPLDIERLRTLASHPRVVAVGETGLDYFKDWAPRDGQERWFRAQIALALDVKKPLIIHSRDAGEDCFHILKECDAERVGGVFHCFAESADFARRLEALNFLVSFPGTVTFKKNDALREIVKAIPLERIMVETDAPYMAPEPYRGKRCEASFVVETARVIAHVKDIPLEELASVTTANAVKLFRIPATAPASLP